MDQNIELIYKKSLTKFASTLSKRYKVDIYPQEVLLRLERQRPLYKVVKDEHNNYVHTETNFIFNANKKVVGKYKDDKQHPLDKQDIETCKQYKFDYDVPFNLEDDYDAEQLMDETDKFLCDHSIGSSKEPEGQ
jgi:hypothetical protein